MMQQPVTPADLILAFQLGRLTAEQPLLWPDEMAAALGDFKARQRPQIRGTQAVSIDFDECDRVATYIENAIEEAKQIQQG